MGKLLSVFALMMLGVGTLAAEEASTDSLPAQELREVVVKGSSVVRKGNSIILFPTSRDRRFASGGVDVLANMHVPEVVVDPLTGEVRASDGEKITMFIDFLPASAQQLREIRPQDIERIDIIRSPADPRFEGARIIANYVMKKYAYGGYTKLDGSQYIPPFSGKYSLYSKFSRAKMTYDISSGLNYARQDDHAGQEMTSHYDFGDVTLERTELTDGYRSRTLTPRVSARAVYQADGITISNLAGFNFTRLKPYDQSSAVDFSDIFDSSSSRRTASQYNRSAIWKGNYYFRLSPVWSLNFSGNFDWSDNADNSSYALNGYAPIINNISEQIVHATGRLSLSRKIGKHFLSLFGSGGWTRNKLLYASDADTELYRREGYGQIGANMNLGFNRFSLSPGFHLSLSGEKVNSTAYTRLLPHAFVPFYLQLSRRSSLNGSFEFAIGGPSASQLSPVLVRTNEVDAVRGNENLSNYRYYNARLGTSRYFGPWLSARLEAVFNCQDNILVPVYTPMYIPGETPMMVRDVINDGTMYRTSLTASLSGSYLDSKLALSMAATVSNYAQRGLTERNGWETNIWAEANFYAGNFQFQAYVNPAVKQYTPWALYKTPLFWYVSAGYSFSNLYVDLRFSNPFVKSYAEEWQTITADNYTSHKTTCTRYYHEAIKLTLSYSFSYGKKLNRNDEVGTLDASESIILKNY